MTRISSLLIGGIAAAGMACAAPVATTVSATPVSSPAPPSAANRQLPNDIRWFRGSAEYRALTTQAYRIAGEKLPEFARGLAPRSWAVILDADETVIDNSEYQRRRFALDSAYTDASWANWVNERAAPAIAGAPEFTRRVHELEGRVVIVTNRAESLCAATRANLEKSAITADLVLCQAPGVSDKNPRFQAVQRGTASSSLPALRVIEWVGDNILDFPTLSQSARTEPNALAEFGHRYFILPNPMYGSWQQNREP